MITSQWWLHHASKHQGKWQHQGKCLHNVLLWFAVDLLFDLGLDANKNIRCIYGGTDAWCFALDLPPLQSPNSHPSLWQMVVALAGSKIVRAVHPRKSMYSSSKKKLLSPAPPKWWGGFSSGFRFCYEYSTQGNSSLGTSPIMGKQGLKVQWLVTQLYVTYGVKGE